MKKNHILFLSILSGLLLSASWPANGFPFLMFFAFIPLLFIENHIKTKSQSFHKFSFFFFSFISFLIWNLLTTWWIKNATIAGVVFAVMLNSLIMATVFHWFHISRKKLKIKNIAYAILVFYWIAFEFIHLKWDISWPWLNLGNAFGNYHKWIQWYEFTGAFGGTLWILVSNILLFIAIKSFRNNKKTAIANGSVAILLFVIPSVISFVIYNNYEEKTDPIEVVVVQPNLDPYNEQYQLPPQLVTQNMIDLAKQEISATSQLVVCPESALQEYIWEDQLQHSISIKIIKNFIQEHPQSEWIVGMSTRRIYDADEKILPSARKFPDQELWYDRYNTAALINKSENIQLYHKSKLTPGVEIMPFSKYLKFVEKMAIDLGGTVGTLRTDPERIPLNSSSSGTKVATLICYESIYGEFCSKFVRNGANLFLIITNDGWWKNSPGHRQHFLFATLRAIENRRSIARSANTGISAFINQRGDSFQKTDYWKPDVISQKINRNDKVTFYTKYGDYIARICLSFSILLLSLTIILKLLKRKMS